MYNAAADLLGRNLVPGRRDRTYLISGDRSWSYEEVGAAADSVGAGLIELGLLAGDRIVIATADRPEFVLGFWGAMLAGMVPIPVSQVLPEEDLAGILRDSGARAIVFDPLTREAATPAAERAGAVAIAVQGPAPAGGWRWSNVFRPRAGLPPPATGEDDIALWLYTSGTTGRPKGVMHRHSHLRAVPAPLAQNVLGLGPGDVLLSVPRMSGSYGLGAVYLTAATGASLVVTPGPVIAGFVHNLMQRANPTVLFGVPAFFRAYLSLSDAGVPGSLRMGLSAGEVLSPDLFHAFRSRFGLGLLDGLGSSEALHHVTCNLPDDNLPGSAGRALEGYEVEALDADGEPVPEGRPGELWIRGPTTFAGYWSRPELTANAYREGAWMRTPDVVRIVDGRVFHQGRVDDMMRLAGVWVAPSEIEEVIRCHPDVADAAVVAVDLGGGSPEIRAVVVSARTDPGLLEELHALCGSRLPPFKTPRSFEAVDDLPRTPSGKVKRFVLRDPAS
jgi:acyl-coenzyme A synthetase/AMP-(fatty) acid ligase